MSAPKDPEKRKLWIQRKSVAMKGKKRKPFSEEHCRNISVANKDHIGYWKGKKRPEILGDLNPTKRPEVKRKISDNNAMKRPEVAKKAGDSKIKRTGGGSIYWHGKAWKLFGKEFCQHDGISLEECKEKYNERFHMHNVDKDFRNLVEENWLCLCQGCHNKLHAEERRINNG